MRRRRCPRTYHVAPILWSATTRAWAAVHQCSWVCSSLVMPGIWLKHRPRLSQRGTILLTSRKILAPSNKSSSFWHREQAPSARSQTPDTDFTLEMVLFEPCIKRVRLFQGWPGFVSDNASGESWSLPDRSRHGNRDSSRSDRFATWRLDRGEWKILRI